MLASRVDTKRVTSLALPRSTRMASGYSSTCEPGFSTPTYFAGEENALVVKAVAQRLERAGESAFAAIPLTLIGPPGCGKSLLSTGIASAWTEAVGEEQVLSITALDLRRRLERAIAGERKLAGSVDQLADRLAAVRLLVIENLEGLAESIATVEFATSLIERISERQGTLVVTAGKPLGEIPGLNARIIGRLASGLTLQVAAPAEAARQELLSASLAARGCHIDPAAASDLAEWLAADARRVLAIAEELHNRFGTRRTISRADARSFVADTTQNQATTPLADIASVVARYYSMPLRLMRSSSRKAPVVLARAVVIYLARQLTALSYEEIGRYLGGRDHTTVMHNYNRINDNLPTDRALRSALDDLFRKLGRAELSSASAARQSTSTKEDQL